MRKLTDEEVAFLAWVFVAAERRDMFDFDMIDMQEEWEERTGQALPGDFMECVVAIYDAQ